jgi:hypothetical protein
MNNAKAGWRQKLGWAWFAVGVLLAFWVHAVLALGTFSVMRVLDFDYMLRLVEVRYAAQGLAPYRDFGFVYPPGQVWFYGKVLRLQDAAAINAAIDLVNLLLWSICAWQLMRLSKELRWWFGGAVFLVLGGAMPLVWGAGSWALMEPLPLLAIATLLVVEVMERGPSRATLIALAGVSAASALFRWDWILGAALLEAGWAATMWLAARTLKHDGAARKQKMATSLWWAAVSALAGVALAAAAVAGYAMATGAWADTSLFMFYLPIHILPFRRLPLPLGFHSSRQWLEAVVGMASIAIAVCVDFTQTKAESGFAHLLKAVALLAPCIALLPYAFGRADETHLLPLTMLVIVTGMAAFALWPNRSARCLFLIAMAINAEPSLHTAISKVSTGGVGRTDLHLERIHKLSAGCTDLFPQDARSIYVGQATYHRFIENSPVFYLLRSDLRPATPFISDEPGVQNSCAFGSRIANDLMRAPRPLVLVLDAEIWEAESNMTRTMTNCGKIEAAIASLHAKQIGACKVVDDYTDDDSRTFRVQVVR